MVVDLHGMTEQEAVGVILMKLLDFDNSDLDEMEFITGRGYVLTRVLEETLEDEGYDYSPSPNNSGSYIIYR